MVTKGSKGEGQKVLVKGAGPPTTLPSMDFRHRFIIAKVNLKVNSLERKWSPGRPRGEKSRKIQYLS